jgi:hypothetical protein
VRNALTQSPLAGQPLRVCDEKAGCPRFGLLIDPPFEESSMNAPLIARERAWEYLNTIKTAGPRHCAVRTGDTTFLPAITEGAMHRGHPLFEVHSAREPKPQNTFAMWGMSSGSIERAAGIVVAEVS